MFYLGGDDYWKNPHFEFIVLCLLIHRERFNNDRWLQGQVSILVPFLALRRSDPLMARGKFLARPPCGPRLLLILCSASL
jgi:hypothetical protein